MRSFILFLLLFSCLFCDPKDPYVVAVTEGEPSTFVANAVNAITGDYFISNPDVVVQGVEPIVIPRNYLSGNGKGNYAGFSFYSHLHIAYGGVWPLGHFTVFEPSGTRLRYLISLKIYEKLAKGKYKHHPIPLELDGSMLWGFVNKGARYNLKNNRVEVNPDRKYVKVYGSNGSERCYQKIPPKEKKKKKKGELAIEAYYYGLMWERLPNGNRIHYGYGKDHRINAFHTSNPDHSKTFASVHVDYHGDDFIFTTNDGNQVHYQCERKGSDDDRYTLIRKILNRAAPEESFDYHSVNSHGGQHISRRAFPQSLCQNVDYYTIGNHQVMGQNISIGSSEDLRCDRVKMLSSPIGQTSALIATHTFIYHPGRRGENNGATEVYDALGNLTVYRYSSSMMIEAIERYIKKEGTQTPFNSERFIWNSEGNLLCKSFHDEAGRALCARTFVYDPKGNMIHERIYGNISGNGTAPLIIHSNGQVEANESYGKWFAYSDDNRNLPTAEAEENGHRVQYSYFAYNRLSSKLELYHGRIIRRTFYDYNSDLVVVREIIDDGAASEKEDLTGVTERRIKVIVPKAEEPYYGMPEEIHERYLDLHSNQEKTISYVHLTYGNFGLVTKKDVYDANGVFRYSLHTTYDDKGRPIEESNALGQVAKSSYDALGNKLTFEDFHGRSIVKMTYDFAGRMIQSEEAAFDGQKRTTEHHYNLLSQRTQTTDFHGETSTYCYDPFGHLLEERSPEVFDEKGKKRTLCTRQVYDSAGNKIEQISPKGEVTKTSYNIYGKPATITYADGSTERFIYNLDGTLAQAIDQQGTSAVYTYDGFGRETSKKIFSSSQELLLEETSIYNGFQLVAKIDAENHKTTFVYDGAGRKISEERAGEKIEYTYDELGRVKIEKKENLLSIKEYDLLGRLIDERMESVEGELLARTKNEYDSFGNIACITRFIAGQEVKELFRYDAFNQPIMQIDALGHTVRFEYDDARHQRTHTDALGNLTIESRDALGRLIYSEKKNSFGSTLSKEEMHYDAASNLSQQLSTVYAGEDLLHVVTTLWEYGQLNRLLTLTEAAGSNDQKITRYTYTIKGQLHTTTKPDGTVLENRYDPLGRLIEQSASDRTISYAFQYNKLGQMVACENRLSGKATLRELDPSGRVIKETLETGFSFENVYDARGRRTALRLPDQSTIAYSYDALYLRAVSRGLYTHRYLDYDLSGHLLKEQIIGGLGEIQYQLDALGRTIQAMSPFVRHTIEEIDAAGHIKKMYWNVIRREEVAWFKYDDLYQLTEEDSIFPHTFSYDSHYNRLSKDDAEYQVNVANELLSTEKTRYDYDKNGCPLTKSTANGEIQFKYDALGRLLEATQAEHFHVEFSYDGLHRRLTKTVYLWKEQAWQKKSHQNFLYDGQCEIGAADEEGKIHQLRVLGSAPHAEIGAAVLIELEGVAYAPAHDIKGSVYVLVDVQTRKVAESYRYTVFGEEIIYAADGNKIRTSAINNPWRFLSKHFDEEIQMVFFGRRYYEPETGRWLTPDPKGFADSLNLYAFVFNDPLTRLDLWGLETLAERGPMGQMMLDFFRTGLEYAHRGICNLGSGIKAFSSHLPPIIREYGMLIGNVLMGARGEERGYYPKSRGGYVGEGSLDERDSYLTGNGILTGYDEVKNRALNWSKNKNNRLVHFFHNATQGFCKDMYESIKGMLGFQTESSKALASYINNIFEHKTGSNQEGTLFTEHHSQGAIDLFNATKLLSSERRAHVNAQTYGSPLLFTSEDLDVQHYVSSKDLIPWINIFNIMKKSHSPNIHRVTSKARIPLVDHGYENTTYSEIRRKWRDDVTN